MLWNYINIPSSNFQFFSFMYFSQYEIFVSYFCSMGNNLLLSLFIWMLKLPQFHQRPFNLASVFFGHVLIIFWALPWFLAQDVLSSSCSLPAPAPKSAISLRIPGSFLVENGIKAKIWDWVCHCHWGIAAPKPIHRTCTHLHMHTYVNVCRHLCVTIHIRICIRKYIMHKWYII